MRVGIVFNPAARGERAQRWQAALRARAKDAEMFPTYGPGSAAELAARICEQGAETVVAAGGDGTVSEVADGIASIPGALDAVRLGVLPLGTVNVFARELGIPRQLAQAWEAIVAGHVLPVDLPRAEVREGSGRRQRHFVQLAGSGLDSRAIAAVSWAWKRRIGPLAYVLAVLEARRGPQPRIHAQAGGENLEGELVLVGNGRFYAGDVTTFPLASLQDGRLDARVFPRVTCVTLCRFAMAWLRHRPLAPSVAAAMQGEKLELTGADDVPVEVDGDNIGFLPATFSVHPRRLRVLVA